MSTTGGESGSDLSWNIELDEQLLQDLYAWVDQVPLSRPKRKIERDFSDGGIKTPFNHLLFELKIKINIISTSYDC
jgi:hypothetical protein